VTVPKCRQVPKSTVNIHCKYHHLLTVTTDSTSSNVGNGKYEVLTTNTDSTKTEFKLNRYAMLDGAAIGTEYDPALDSGRVVCKNPKALWKAIEESREITIIAKKADELVARMDPWDNESGRGCRDLPIKRTIYLDLKMSADKKGKKRWHFNIRTNPASVFTGDNTFGSLMVVRQIREVFNFILDYFEDMGVNVEVMRKQVQRGDIVLSSIAFAVYSDKVKNSDIVRRLLDKWYFMYETRVEYEGRYVTLLEALGLSRSSGEQFADSLGLNIFGYNLAAKAKSATDRGHKLMHLCLYDKAAENDDELVDDLERRIRFDLTISRYYFNTAWNMKHVTLRNLYMKMKEKGSWENVVLELMNYAIDRTCLQYMAVAPNVYAAEHSEILDLWTRQIEQRKGRGSGKWDPKLIRWAEELGVKLKVSPIAHLIMHQGRLGLHMNRMDKAKEWLSSPEGAKKYGLSVTKAAELERKQSNFARAVSKLELDFSSPTYVRLG